MSSSGGVRLFLTLLLVFFTDSSESRSTVTDSSPFETQRDITEELLGDVLELPLNTEEMHSFILQRPVIPDLSKVMGLLDMTQREVTNFHPENVPKGHPVFRPRSMGPDVDFPPAFPNAGNLQDICQFSKAPVRYPREMFPESGFGYMYRQGEAINQLQSWYSVCCGIDGTEEEQICCAEQAWKKSLSAYCSQEFTIKTNHYFCCKKNGKARWSCFDKEASDSSYHVSPEISSSNTTQKSRGFKYNPSTCKGSLVASPKALKKQTASPDFSFPPGLPDSSNIVHICTHGKGRPRYNTTCVPSTGFGWLVRQSKAINVLEKGYSQCCKEKKSQQRCAVKKWKKMVDKFCKDEKKSKGEQFECCGKQKGEEQYACFASFAPDPGYRFIDGALNPSPSPPSLDTFCDIHATIQSMKGFPLSVDRMVERCCPQVLQERPACIEAELDSHLNSMCKTEEVVKSRCCAPKIKNRVKCATKILLRYIGKSNKVKEVGRSGRKKCPK